MFFLKKALDVKLNIGVGRQPKRQPPYSKSRAAPLRASVEACPTHFLELLYFATLK